MVLKKSLKNGFKLDDKVKLDVSSSRKSEIVKKGETDKGSDDGKRIVENEDDEVNTDGENDYVSPDGGWGWMVTLGLIAVFVTTIGPNASFTIVFGDFLESTGQAGSVTTMLNSLFNITYSLAGLVTNSLLKQFSMRSVGIVGALLFAVPNVMMAFIRHVMEMAVIFFFQGIGLGLIFTICNTNFNAWFDKKRSMVMGVSQVIVGLGGIVYPIMIELMLEEYGFRGTAVITGALSLHCITAMALMRPPASWEAKFRTRKSTKDDENKDQKVEESEKLLGPVKSVLEPREIDSLKKTEKWNSTRSLQGDERNKRPELAPETKVTSVTDVETCVRRERSNSLLVSNWPDWKTRKASLLATGLTSCSLTNLRVQPGTENLNNAVIQLHRASIVAATPINEGGKDDEDEVNVVVDVPGQKTPKFFRIRRSRLLDDLIDFSLLKDRRFLNMCLGISFVFTSDFTFASFLPMMMTSSGFTKADAALAITTSASAELVSRVCLATFTIFIDARPKTMIYWAMIAMTFAKIGYLYLADTLTGTIITIAAIGGVRPWLLVPQPLVVVENVGADQFAAAYGLFAIVSGVISVILGPLAGLIKDWTDSFVVCQLVLLVMNVVFIVPWSMEYISDRKKAKKKLESVA